MFEPGVHFSGEVTSPAMGVVCQEGWDAPARGPGTQWELEGNEEVKGGLPVPPGQENRSLLINRVSKRQNKAWGWILTSQTRFLIKNNFSAFVSPPSKPGEEQAAVFTLAFQGKKR